MKIYDVIIIGGGASGMMCASMLNKNYSVALIDAGFSIGKKIMVTGNGRCNLTNSKMDSSFFNVNIDNFLKRFGYNETIKYFKSIGLETIEDNEGRVYPFSNYAKSVIDVLYKSILRCGNVDIITNTQVVEVNKSGSEFVVCDNKCQHIGKKIVVCVGNSDNDFIKNFNLKSNKRAFSLVALKVKENTKGLEGVRINNVKLTAKLKGKTKTQVGELLFKDSGISGIAVFNLSTLFARDKNYAGVINIDLMPGISESKTIDMLKKRCLIFDKIVDMLDGLFVPAVREEIFKRCKLNDQLQTNKLNDSQLQLISNTIHNLQYNIVGHYDNYQVVSGGVILNELTDNLECKKYNGIYFAGEVIDVDGECGGYNLQWAWTSAAIIANSINNN